MAKEANYQKVSANISLL